MKMKGILDVQDGQDEEGYRLAKLTLPAGERRGDGQRITHFLA